MSRLRMLSMALMLAAGAAARADASLMDKEQALAALKGGSPCCVVDGRAAETRRTSPLPDAVPYRKGLQIAPTAPAVVVADDDRAALAIAQALEKSHPGKTIIAIQGGVPVWQSILAGQGAPQGAINFVIPRNTCEHDTPLQKLLQKKP